MAVASDTPLTRPRQVRLKPPQQAQHPTRIERYHPRQAKATRKPHKNRYPHMGSSFEVCRDVASSSKSRKPANVHMNQHLDYFSRRMQESGTRDCVFICWDSGKGSIKAVDVPILIDGDEEGIYRLLRDQYYKRRFILRKYFFSPSVEQAKVCICLEYSR